MYAGVREQFLACSTRLGELGALFKRPKLLRGTKKRMIAGGFQTHELSRRVSP